MTNEIVLKQAPIVNSKVGTRNPIQILKGIYYFFRLVGNLKRLDDVIRISDRIVNDDVLMNIKRSLDRDIAQGHSHIQQAFHQKPRIRVKLDDLKTLPPGTLGRILADGFIKKGLDPNDLPDYPVTSEMDFIRAHLYETHDIWHVATGFETDEAGELGLQGFYIAQMPVPLGLILVAAVMLNTALFNLSEREVRMNAFFKGYRLGKQARPFFGIRWDKLWDKPLIEVQRELNITPA